MVNLFVVCVPEKRTDNILRMPIRSPMLTIQGAPADHDSKMYYAGPTLRYVSIHCCFMGSILWLYLTHRLFFICAPDTHVTKNHYSKGTIRQVTIFFQTSCFDLVKVHSEAIFII